MTRQLLFDGSLTLEVPAGFESASKMRPVPDNQEMFVNFGCGASLLVDVLEAVEEKEVATALQIHAVEVFSEAQEPPRALSITTIELPSGPGGCVRRVAYGTAEDISMALFRVPECSADILLTVHGWSGNCVSLFKSFRIESLSLFAGENRGL